MTFSVVIPFTPESASTAVALAEAVWAPGADVLLAGPQRLDVTGARALEVSGGPGRALRQGLQAVKQPITIVLDPHLQIGADDVSAVAAPVANDTADAVFGEHPSSSASFQQRTLIQLVRRVTGVAMRAPFSGVRAFRTDALQKLSLRAEDEAIDP